MGRTGAQSLHAERLEVASGAHRPRRSAHFDYSAVDSNERYDDTEQQGRDAEERWFDDSDEEL